MGPLNSPPKARGEGREKMTLCALQHYLQGKSQRALPCPFSVSSCSVSEGLAHVLPRKFETLPPGAFSFHHFDQGDAWWASLIQTLNLKPHQHLSELDSALLALQNVRDGSTLQRARISPSARKSSS